MPDADAVAPALARFLNLPAFALRHLKYVTTNAVASAPVADDERSYPVLILLVGLGGYRQVQTCGSRSAGFQDHFGKLFGRAIEQCRRPALRCRSKNATE